MELILIDFMSLDGVVQAPGGPDEDTDGGFAHGGWSHPYFDAEVMGLVIGDVMAETEALLFGRRTWEVSAAAWPGRAGDPYADSMNAIRKYVASRSLSQDDLHWENSELLDPADAVAAIGSLREQEGGALQIFGSPSLGAQLVEAGLVDRFVAIIEPVLLGGGKRVFPEGGRKQPLELVDVKQASTGVLVCTYRPAA